jgi:hypothetical protein
MKSLLIIALALITSTQAMAETRTVTLQRDARVIQRKMRSSPVHFITLFQGTRLEVNMNPAINRNRARGKKLVRVNIVYSDNLYYGSDSDKVMNINSAYRKDYRSTNGVKVAYFMNKRDLKPVKRRRVVVEQEPTHYPRYEDRPGYSDSRRGYEDRPRYDDNSYEVCYEAPRRRYKEVVDQQRYRRGTTTAATGAIITGLGLIIGGDAGNIVAGAGAGIGIFGLIEMGSSTQTFFENGNVDCRRYYQTQRRQVYINSQSCTTTRYYSSQWSGYGGHSSHEYFQTTCSGRSYMTFDRHQGVW